MISKKITLNELRSLVKQIIKEETSLLRENSIDFPIGTFSNQQPTKVNFTGFENNVKAGHIKPRNDGSYSVSIKTDAKWGNYPFIINAYISKEGNKIMQVWFSPQGTENYIKQESIKDYSPMLKYIMDNNKEQPQQGQQPQK